MGTLTRILQQDKPLLSGTMGDALDFRDIDEISGTLLGVRLDCVEVKRDVPPHSRRLEH